MPRCLACDDPLPPDAFRGLYCSALHYAGTSGGYRKCANPDCRHGRPWFPVAKYCHRFCSNTCRQSRLDRTRPLTYLARKTERQRQRRAFARYIGFLAAAAAADRILKPLAQQGAASCRRKSSRSKPRPPCRPPRPGPSTTNSGP